MGAIQFIENLDRTSLTISDEDFEKHVEAAVSLIAEKHSKEEAKPPLPSRHSAHTNQLPVSEKSAPSRAEVVPRNSLEAERSTHRRGGSLRNGSKTDSDEGEEMAAMTGLLKTIQLPLSTIGRIFSDDTPPVEKSASGLQPPLTPQPTRKLSPASSAGDSSSQPRRCTEHARQQQHQQQQQQQEQEQKELRQKLSAEDAAARQASAEAEEARRLRVREEANVVETLCGMFPGLDRDVIMDVVRANEGR
jgi:Rab5 GDP/GTP exchange factor